AVRQSGVVKQYRLVHSLSLDVSAGARVLPRAVVRADQQEVERLALVLVLRVGLGALGPLGDERLEVSALDVRLELDVRGRDTADAEGEQRARGDRQRAGDRVPGLLDGVSGAPGPLECVTRLSHGSRFLRRTAAPPGSGARLRV